MGSHGARPHILSLFFLVCPAPQGRGNDSTSSAAVAGLASILERQLRPQPARDAVPCSHHSPSTFINKLPLITAVIAKLFHSRNYSSQPNPGYLGRALSLRVAASQIISSPGLFLVVPAPKCSTRGWGSTRVGPWQGWHSVPPQATTPEQGQRGAGSETGKKKVKKGHSPVKPQLGAFLPDCWFSKFTT